MAYVWFIYFLNELVQTKVINWEERNPLLNPNCIGYIRPQIKCELLGFFTKFLSKVKNSKQIINRNKKIIYIPLNSNSFFNELVW